MPQAAVLEARSNLIVLPGRKEEKLKRKKVYKWDDRADMEEEEHESKKSANAFRSVDEVNLMLTDFLKCGEWRDALLYVTALNTRFRAVDLSILKWKNVLNADHTVKSSLWFKEQKTGKSITIAINEAFSRMIFLYIRKVGAPSNLNYYMFMPLGNRKSYFYDEKDRCDEYAVAKEDVADRVIGYADRGIQVSLEDYSRNQIRIVFTDGSTIDWPYNRQEKLWIRERRHSDIPVGLSPESISNIIKKKAEKLGIYNTEGHRITAHTTRKTAITAGCGALKGREIPDGLFNRTLPPSVTSRWANHSSTATTARYIGEEETFAQLDLFINLGIEAIEEFERKENLNYDKENT